MTTYKLIDILKYIGFGLFITTVMILIMYFYDYGFKNMDRVDLYTEIHKTEHKTNHPPNCEICNRKRAREKAKELIRLEMMKTN